MSNKKLTEKEIFEKYPPATEEDWEAFEKQHGKIKAQKKFHEETKGIPDFLKHI